MEISNSTIMVAGGGSGLGAACCLRFEELGANVVVADIQPPRQRSERSSWLFAETDVTNEASVRDSLKTALDRFGNLHGVAICAGILHTERIVGKFGPFELDAFRRVIEVNLVGTFNVLRLAAEAMSHNKPLAPDGERGVIVTTSSVAAFEGQIGQAAYSASKGGVAALTLPAARELGRYGIRVVSIAPGVFETPMIAQLSEEQQQAFVQPTAFPHRLGRPKEFALLVEHVFENTMLNGEVIRLDGALRMPAK